MSVEDNTALLCEYSRLIGEFEGFCNVMLMQSLPEKIRIQVEKQKEKLAKKSQSIEVIINY